MSTSTTTTTEARALALLGNGVPPGAVANALGVDPSRITQLLGNDDFAAKVVEAKFLSLSKHSERDTAIDSLEDKLLEKLKDVLPFMTRPMEILKAFSVLNAAKRKSQSAAAETLTARQNIITLNLPSIIIEKFQVNVHNQVTQVNEQTLVTMQSGSLLKKVEAANATKLLSAQTTQNSQAHDSLPKTSLSSQSA